VGVMRWFFPPATDAATKLHGITSLKIIIIIDKTTLFKP
jgi:hypothetical protein